MSEDVVVLKIGGNQIDEPAFLTALAETVAGLRARPVIVHGGGKEIGQLHMDLGIPFHVVAGLRVTSDATLRVAEMVLSGLVNKRLVASLVNAGVPAIGLSGVDLGILRVEKLEHPGGDLGWVGHVVEVNVAGLGRLLADGLTPILSPISLGRDGHTYNVNADHAAEAVACALQATALVLVSNVPGVLLDGELIAQLSAARAEELIATGAITGGMIPKVQAALDAVTAGVPEARIVDLEGLKSGRGTKVMRDA